VSAALESVLPEIQVVCALFGVDKHEYVAAANALAFETVQFEESAKFITCAKRMVKTFTLPVPFVMSVHNSADVLSIDCYHRILHFGRADAPWAAGPLLPLCDATAGHVWRGDALVLMAEHAGAPSRSTVAIMNACAAELDPDRVRVYMACRPTGASARIRAAAPGVADELPRLLFVPAGRVDRAVAMDDPDFSVSSIRAFVSRLRTPDGT
jgi:hypothetical protein